MKFSLPYRVLAFVAVTATAGLAVFGLALLHFQPADLLKFGCYLLIAALASTLKVRLPGMESTMSVHFLFVLLGVLELSLAETLIIGCAAALLQSVWRTKRPPEPIKVLFNVFGMTSPAIYLTYRVYHLSGTNVLTTSPLLLLIAALTYFLTNTLPVSVVIALSARTSLRKIWTETFFWSLPYYLIGAALVGIIHFSTRYVGWQNALLIVPMMYWVYRSYHLYLARLEDEKKRVEVEAKQVEAEKRHVEEVCALHLRTIEGLALAIEAKDQSTHSHLHRVRTYALEIGKELGLSGEQLDALRAAALLHDIGKLAVPDHIINKPGRLTPEEFEKMKIHPIVGAEILEKVAFPYPVAPIVRSHHEKWNGAGYPDGLTGEEIPIGARILSVVDCLDALTSDRQYRKALPFGDAMVTIFEESGESFDPTVVEVLQRRGVELESFSLRQLVTTSADALRFTYNVERGESPATGLQSEATRTNQSDFLSSIASARQEAHTLFELSQDLGNSLSLDETLSLVAMRLRKIVPYDSIVAFVRRGDALVPEFVSGDNSRLFASLVVPVGTGLCGWVAQNVKPIINGNPAVETGFGGGALSGPAPRSALAVPLEGVEGLVGVLALYRAETDAFTSEHLRILQVVTARVALFIENALKYREAEHSATVDYLTGMGNARALSMHLEQELARCGREGGTVAVMVCDLDGFKQINDRYGHLAGDKVLKLFAASMRDECSHHEYAARMGGDEFVILAPNATKRTAAETARKLSALAQQAGREVCGNDFLSLSLGAAFYPQDGTDAEKLLFEADRRMYAMKTTHHGKAERPAADAPLLPEVVAIP